MKNKNRNLLILLAVQVVIIAVLAFSKNSAAGVDYDPGLFTISDTASIERIELVHNDQKVILEKSGDKWLINKDEVADRSLVFFTKSILNRVEVKRPISSKNQAEIYSSIMKEGAQVKVYDREGMMLEFYAGGNEGKTKSYFAKEDKPYIVNVPGYQDYLSGIFKLKAHQWKDRLIAKSSWRSISSIEVDKTDGKGFEVIFTGTDLMIRNVEPLDTTKMMSYVSQFQQFMINEFVLEGQFDRYDSLKKTAPMATLKLQDLDPNSSLDLKIFPRFPDEAYHLVTDAKGRMMMIDMRRVAGLIPPRDFFRKEKRRKPLF